MKFGKKIKGGILLNEGTVAVFTRNEIGKGPEEL